MIAGGSGMLLVIVFILISWILPAIVGILGAINGQGIEEIVENISWLSIFLYTFLSFIASVYMMRQYNKHMILSTSALLYPTST